MASVYLRYNDIWYASYKLADGTWKTPETTKIRNSVYGSRKAKKLALLKANEWEQRELDIRHGRIDLPSIVSYVDLLSDEDKTKLAIILSNNLPGSSAINGGPVADQISTRTYKEIRDAWLKGVIARGTTPTRKQVKVTEGWLSKEQTNYNVFTECVGENTPITNITLEVVQNFIDDKSLEGKSGSTIAKYLQTTRMIFEYAIQYKYYSKDDGNPVEDAKKPGQHSVREYIALPHSVVNEAIRTASDKDKIYWTFLKNTGLNPVDISELTKDSIVTRTSQSGKDIRAIVIWRKKTKDSAKKPVNIVLNDAVTDVLDTFGNKCFGLFDDRNKRNKSTIRFKKSIIKQGYKTEEDLEKEIFGLGCLRHSSFTYRAIDSDASLDEIQNVSGHNTKKLLNDVYIKDTNWDRELELANAINK